MHPNGQIVFTRYCVEHFKPGLRVLELGPSLGGAAGSWYRTQCPEGIEWLTADIREDRSPTGRHHDVDFTGTCYAYPIPDDAFDIVFAAFVIEHVPMPWRWIQELTRCCRPGGLVIVLAPFVGPQHGKLDCFRFLPQGMEALAEWARLDVVHCELFALKPGDYRGPDTEHVDTLLIGRKP